MLVYVPPAVKIACGNARKDRNAETEAKRLHIVCYRVIDLRALFTEMCDGGTSNSGHRNRRSSTNIKGSSKERLSGSGLARGLKHAGLPLDRALVDQLVVVFSSGGGRGRRLAYADFHRMVHCDGLLEGGFGAMGGGSGVGYAGRAGTLDEQVRT